MLVGRLSVFDFVRSVFSKPGGPSAKCLERQYAVRRGSGRLRLRNHTCEIPNTKQLNALQKMASSKVQDNNNDKLAITWTGFKDNAESRSREAHAVLRNITPTVANLLVEKISTAPNVQLVKQVFGYTSKNSSNESSYVTAKNKPESCCLFIVTSLSDTPQRVFASAVGQCLKELDVLEKHFL